MDDRFDERDRDGPSLKRHRPDQSAAGITILVEAELTSMIVGKGGSNIRQLESDFQVRIQCEKPNSGDRSAERPVIISSSSIDNKVMAVRSITEMLLSAKPAPHATIKLVIPPEAAPVIIGKQGNSVKQLMTNSGAHIDVIRDGERFSLPPGLQGSRLVMITGSIDSACSALSMITHRLSELDAGSGQSSMMSRQMPPMEAPYRGRSIDTAPYMRMEQLPPSGSMYGMSGDMGMMRGDMGMMRGDMRGDMGMMRNSGNSYGSSMGGMSYPPPMPVHHGHSHGRDRERASRSLAACTLNMFVPATIVRLVIGKMGSNIKEVIRQCDDLVTINVEKEGDAGVPPPDMCVGTVMRSVVIKGPSSAVLKAAYIIQERVSCEYEDLQWTVVAMQPSGGEHSGRHHPGEGSGPH